MQELKKILEEINKQKRICLEIDNGDEFNAGALDMANSIKDIIRKHMNDDNSREHRAIGLEGILEEIERLEKIQFSSYTEPLIALKDVKEMIRRHMNDDKCGKCSRRKWYQKGYEDGKKDNDGWIPCEECLPEDGESVLCTDGEYVYLVEYDADSDAGFGDMDNMIAWRPLPEPYRPKKGSVQNETA